MPFRISSSRKEFYYRFTERAQEAVDAKIATLQYQHLIEDEQWLSDEQVNLPLQ